MKSRKAVMHVLSHTHWDREWYQDFQGYRQRLVFQMDAMMDLLEARPEFRYFHLDGQTSVILDYLEIRPESRERLLGHVKSGRVLVGPWFVMPDERLLSGESMMRNLQLGHALSREFGGKPMAVGYVTDIFGHCSQFPQILKGFHIDAAMLHRGINVENETSELVWEGADGTETLIAKIYPYTGYNDFMTFREWSDAELLDYEDKKLSMATTDVLFALDGNDHQPAKWDVPEQIARANGVFRRIQCVHSSMPRYLAALRKALGPRWQKGRKRFVGELTTPARYGQWSEVMFGIGSSRPYLKQYNDMLEQLLPRAAEALHAWSVSLGGRSQKGFLDRAWRYLLLNHPHDSICGCSIDQVHRDMMYRFDQARLISEQSLWESAQAIGDMVDTTVFGEGEEAVTVFNPANADAGPVADFTFDVRSDVARRKLGEGLVPALYDADGRLVPMQTTRVERETRAVPFTFITTKLDAVTTDVVYKEESAATPLYKPRSFRVDRLHVSAAANVPALGYASWRLGFARPEAQRDSASQAQGSVSVSEESRRIGNGIVSLEIDDRGRVTLDDKATGRRFGGLHAFEDVGDAGEGWSHKYPDNDRRIVTSDDGVVEDLHVEAGLRGPLCGSLKVSFAMRVPEDLEYERVPAPNGKTTTVTSRSGRLAVLRVETTFTLRAGSRRVDCRTVVANTARCHRMRVMLPTAFSTDSWYGDSAFDVVKRDVRLLDTTGWKEQAREEAVIKSFAAVCDANAGLAVLTKGLNEATVRDDAERTLALTLFRAFREDLLFEETRDSQLIGDVVSEYALLPFEPADAAPPAGIFADVERYKMPLYSYARAAQEGPLPAEGRLMEVSQPAVVSTIKTSEDGKAVIARIWNPTNRAVTVTLRPSFEFRSAARADFLEKPEETLDSKRGAVKVRLARKQVATVRFNL